MKRELMSDSLEGSAQPPKQQRLTTGCLTFDLLASDGSSRSSVITLPHGDVLTPVFMPVGTYGAMKGIPSPDLAKLGPQIILANTYHVGNRPGADFLRRAGGLHAFMKWNGNMLTDSGGFQMVSLAKLLSLSEEGVEFESPVDQSKMLLTPELSMDIQNAIGADIMMVLDDVVESTSQDSIRMKEATERTIRWLDRCISAHKRPESQNLFAIVQGGLDPKLREWSLSETIKRDTPGFAIGGLSGGEGKEAFWRVVAQCCKALPSLKPRYVMGVGYPLDILCCVALGADMFDCVYPTRTARFGTALVPGGQMRLSNAAFKIDSKVIQEGCPCRACAGGYSRAYLHPLAGRDAVVARLLSEHNIVFMITFMADIRAAIKSNTFEKHAGEVLSRMFSNSRPPIWVRNALVEGAGMISIDTLFDWTTEVEGSDNPHVLS